MVQIFPHGLFKLPPWNVLTNGYKNFLLNMAPIAEKYAKKKRYSIVTFPWIVKKVYAKNSQWWLPLSKENHWLEKQKDDFRLQFNVLIFLWQECSNVILVYMCLCVKLKR